MSACLMLGATLLTLADPVLTLSWTHSVEHVEWRESWQVGPEALTLVEARVKGSGAGMEPGPEAVLDDGWWTWHPGTTVPDLRLAASGATGGGWTLCTDNACREIGAASGEPLRLAPCDAPAG